MASTFSPETKADIEATRTYLTPTADGFTSYTSPYYSVAWDAYSGDLDVTSDYWCGGVAYGEGLYGLSRAAVYYSTADIPDGANITEAIISLYVDEDYSDTDFNVTVQGTGTYPHYPLQAADYYQGWYGSTSMGSRNTGDGLSVSSYWNITLNSVGIAQISKTGTTRFFLRSQNDIDYVTPTGYEYVTFASRDMGESYAAKLYVTYTVPESGGSEGVYHYYIYGPYEDSGAVLNGDVDVRLYPSYNETLEFTLSGDGTTPDFEQVDLEQQAVLMTWNISATENYTRVLYFTTDYVETVYVFVPDADLPFYLYAFTINDLVGVTNGFLESRVYANGTSRVVERQPINTINAAPFYMEWSRKYDMRVVCDEGELSIGAFTALTETNPNVMIPMGAFPYSSHNLNVLATAERIASTEIQINYTDSDEATYWIRVYIKHRLSTGTYATDYYENSSSNTYSYTWTDAEDDEDYYVQLQAYRTDGAKEWSFYCPYQRNLTNVWEGLNYLGSGLPFEVQYLPAIVLVAAAILSFSFGFISAGAWVTWGALCTVFLFGWLPWTTGSAIAVGLGAVICSGITIGEFKKGERSL